MVFRKAANNADDLQTKSLINFKNKIFNCTYRFSISARIEGKDITDIFLSSG